MVAMTLPAKPWTNGMMTADGTRMFDSTVGSEGAWRATPIPAGGLPAGSIIQWSSNTAPPNWLICDGSAVSRTLWPSLFATIGTTYGSGDGSTTFNLPDLRGRVAVGKNSGTFGTLGGVGGAETESHAHWTVVGNPTGTPYTHLTLSDSAGSPAIRTKSSVNRRLIPEQSYLANTTTYESATYDATTSNLQPYLVTNYIIKATTGWSAGDSELALRMAAAETAAATTNKSGLVPLIPTSVDKSGGTVSVASDGTVTFTDVSQFSLNGIFLALYRDYKLMLQIFSNTSDSIDLRFRLRTSGVDNVNSSYAQLWTMSRANGTIQSNNGWGIPTSTVTRWWSTTDAFITVNGDVLSPQIAKTTKFQYKALGWDSTSQFQNDGTTVFANGTQFDGFTFYPTSGVMSGVIKVLGYR